MTILRIDGEVIPMSSGREIFLVQVRESQIGKMKSFAWQLQRRRYHGCKRVAFR